MKGLFITIEGPDGAGKTSVIKELIPRLSLSATCPIYMTREPGGNHIAEKIRALILDQNNTEIDERTEALLYAASRRQHLVETIIPHLNNGDIVICDRFVDSSLAYQGAGRKIGMNAVEQMNQFATEGIQPDLTLYLDVDSDTGLARILKNRHDEMNRLDYESLDFHQRVRHGYLKLVQEYPHRIKKIDARQTLIDVVNESLWTIKKTYPNFFKQTEKK